MNGAWIIAGQGAVNQYHEVVILERGDDRIAIWLPRDRDLDFVVANARVEADNAPSETASG